MAHFIKSDIEDKKIDELFEKIDDIDLDKYQKKLIAGDGITISEANVISADLSDYQEKLTAGSGISISADNVISSTASGGTQLYLHHITSSLYSTSVFDCYFVTTEPEYTNLNALSDVNDFVNLLLANVDDSASKGSKYYALYYSYKLPQKDDTTKSISKGRILYIFTIIFSGSNIWAPTTYSLSATFNSFENVPIADITLSSLTDTVTAL